jgi:proteasome lid subunit RPN8/RPN11
MLAIFHSHPGAHAYPSSVDIEKAYWPGTKLPNYPSVAYIIVSLLDRASPVARGYLIEEGKVSEMPLTVIQ